MKKKIAVIWMSFHKKTKSFDFLKNLLSTTWDIELFYDSSLEGWSTDKSYLKRKNEFEYMIFLQVLPGFFDILKIKDKNIVFVPMYDSMWINKYAWLFYKPFNIKIICFCKKIYDLLTPEWFDCFNIQYYLEPLKYNVDYSSKNIFFWYRWNIFWEDIKIMIWSQAISWVTIKNNPKKYNISFLEKFFDTHEEYYWYLAKHNIFIAPRKMEWIWMSFLDAMSIWQCVVWYNEATMNEYLIDWINWYLTDFKHEVNLDKYREVWERSKDMYIGSFNHWVETKIDILKYISWNYSRVEKVSLKHYLVYGLIILRRKILILKTKLKWNSQ
jgi:hypothetical protein